MSVNKAYFRWLLSYPVLLACSFGVIISTAPAYAGGEINATFFGKVAIGGYDPVAYFTMGKAVKGKKDLTHQWLDVNWRFVSAKHRELFAADPTKYTPQHGGFCSAGASDGEKVRVNPRVWQIVDDKLYLFYGKSTADNWDPDSAAVIKADDDWLKTLSDLTQ